jgi:hypothetical protein
MKLNITFSNDENVTQTLSYQLLENPVVDKFVSLINQINSKPFVEVQYTNICIYDNPKEKLHEKYNELITNIRLFEEENNNGICFSHKFNLQDISNEKLNNLHTEFEKFIILFCNSDNLLTSSDNVRPHDESKALKPFSENIITYLNNVNCLIHYLEDIFDYEKNDNNGFYSTYLYSKPYVRPILLEESDYDLFTLDYNFGDLFLGYGTTGKSLFHLFKDNDINLLEKGFVLSPQQYITPNIISLFKTSAENYSQSFKDWYDKNDIKNKYNIDFNKYNSNGYIKLGELIYTDKKTLIENLIGYNKITGYEIVM